MNMDLGKSSLALPVHGRHSLFFSCPLACSCCFPVVFHSISITSGLRFSTSFSVIVQLSSDSAFLALCHRQMSSVDVCFLCQGYDPHQMTGRAFLILLSCLIEGSSRILKKREVQNSTPVGYATFYFFCKKI